MFFKGLYDAAKWSVLVAFAVFLLSALGVQVFPNDVNSYSTYLVTFLFILVAILTTMY